MPKPVVALRSPRPVDADAFVNLDAQRPAVQPANVLAGQHADGRKVQTRADGRQLRKQTIYLPVELSKELRVRAAQDGSDQSTLIAAALAAYLGRPAG